MESLIADARYTLLVLRRDPNFTVAAVFTVAMGIAVNTAVFTAFDVTLRPIQATGPGRVAPILSPRGERMKLQPESCVKKSEFHSVDPSKSIRDETSLRG